MSFFLKTKDHALTQEVFELHYDEAHDMLITSPQPQDLDSYYNSEAYISHTDASRSLVDKLYQTVKRHNLKKKTRQINAMVEKPTTLLDIGAGTGDFLLAAKAQGWKVTGVEPNPKARGKANEKGLSLHKTLNEVSGKKYKVITLWHVLEHLPDLQASVTAIAKLLDEGGVLFIAVPNYRSYDAKHYKTFWAAYDVPRHLWHFSRKSLEILFGAKKLKLVAAKPMVFDAFYVSLLSEEYKTGKKNYLRAFWNGLLSNIKAISTKEYSSLLYVLR